MSQVPPLRPQPKRVSEIVLTNKVAAAPTLFVPGAPRIVGVDADGRSIGWFQCSGICVTCVVPAAQPFGVARRLPGFREAVALLRTYGAISLEYVSAHATRIGALSGTD